MELEEGYKLGYINMLVLVCIADWCIGKSLIVQLRQAFAMKIKQEAILAQFTAKFAPDVVEKWAVMIDDWELDPEKPNPYEEVGKG
jgi:hypothetical protein